MADATPEPATQRYVVLLTPDLYDGGYTVTVPSLPGCITDGETIEEALVRAREAIALHMDLPDDANRINGDRIEVIVATVTVVIASS